ncbi:MAG: DUF4373 domain-containing protein [Tenericutes bacterium]|nr:DUF4373 domain-containing protein [Mycoplasmatota bacterium]
MARPIKKGLSYFPLDVGVFKDKRITKIERKFGVYGSSIFLRILTMVYEHGYYLEMTEEDLITELIYQIGVSKISYQRVRNVILMCCELGILDEPLFRQGVITSDGIQKQFIRVAKRRKEVDISKYWLLDSATMEDLGVLLSMEKNEEKGVNVNNNSVNVDINKQSKSKRKRDKLIKEDKSIYGFPKMHFLTKLLIQRKYIEEIDADIMKYNDLFESAIDEYSYENVLSGVNYIISYARHPDPPIEDKFNFMKVSLITNLDRFRSLENRRGETFEDWFKNIFLQVD